MSDVSVYVHSTYHVEGEHYKQFHLYPWENNSHKTKPVTQFAQFFLRGETA